MKIIMIFYNNIYIEEVKVHHTWTDEKIEDFVDEWCEKHRRDGCKGITWCFAKTSEKPLMTKQTKSAMMAV